MRKFLMLFLFSGISYSQTLPPSTTVTVDLSWTAPASGISGYNVYRALGSGSFSMLNTLKITTTSYTDTALSYGVSYQYYATAVDSLGEESSPSNTITLPIPFVPYAPNLGSISAL